MQNARFSRCQLLSSTAMGLALLFNHDPAMAADLCTSPGVVISTTLDGAVDNCMVDGGGSATIAPTGSISGGTFGAGITDNGNSLDNQGTLSGTDQGVLLTAAVSGSPSFTNSGSVTGAAGVRTFFSLLPTRLTNSGSITGTSGNGIESENTQYDDGLENSGTVQATGDGINSVNVVVTGGVENSGTITAGGDGIEVDQSMSNVSGGVTNTATGVIDSDGYGIYIDDTATVAGGINNAGTITAGDDAIKVIDRSTVDTITNQGSLVTDFDGIEVSDTAVVTGAVTNSGTITAADNGVEIKDDAQVGSVVNSGTVTAVDFGIVGNDATIGAITNSGTLDVEDGIVLEDSAVVAGSIENAATGAINATGNGIIMATSTTVTSVANAGTISSDGLGILISDDATVTGTISNAGTITSTSNSGIRVESSDVGGAIENTGTLSSSLDGIIVANSSNVGGITNSGAISATGTGTSEAINLSGNATVDGDIVNTGTMNASGPGIAVFAGSDVTGTIRNAGTIAASDSGVYVSNAGVGAIVNETGGTIDGGFYAINIVTPAAPVTITNAGILDGWVEFGAGTLNLNGNAAEVRGRISGGSGTLNVNGQFASTDLINVGTLSIAAAGELTLGGNANGVVTNSGTLAIGDGDARTITGSYTQATGGVLELGANSALSFGTLSVTGVADFTASDAISIAVSPTETFANGDVIDDVITAGTLNASSVTMSDDSARLTFTGTVDGNTIDISVDASLIADFVTSPNAGAVAAALDEIDAGSPSVEMQTIIDAVNSLSTDAEIEAATAQLLPTIAGNQGQAALLAVEGSGTRVVRDRLIRLSGLEAREAVTRNSVADPSENALTWWVRPFTSRGEQDADGANSGYTNLTTGLAFGADKSIDAAWRTGLALSYSSGSIENTDGNSTVDTDTAQLTLYGTRDLSEHSVLKMLVGFGTSQNSSERNVTFGGLGLVASSEYDSRHIVAGIEWERGFQSDQKWSWAPSFGLTYSQVDFDGYTETGGGGANLTVSPNSSEQLVLSGNVRTAYRPSADTAFIASLGVNYDLFGDRAITSATFSDGGATFVTQASETDRLGVTAALNYNVLTGNGGDLSVGYSFDAASGSRSHTVQANYRIEF